MTTLSGTEATEQRLETVVPGVAVVHLATHGYFASAHCAGDALPDRSPLSRSGIVLAGANADSRGVWTAEEVASVDLSGVGLVVLSACETGLGDAAPGEGVLGLRRALSMAGARSLVVSLWKVPDAATAELMRRFYKRLRRGATVPVALREAQLAVIDSRRREALPAVGSWSAFLAAGDPDVRLRGAR